MTPDAHTDPEDAEAWHARGVELVGAGRVAEGVSALHRAMSLLVLDGDPVAVARTRRELDRAAGRSMVRVGVGAVVRRADGALLLVRRRGVHGDGTWSTPGGHLDFGETPEACAVREAAEETGVTVANPRLVGHTNDVMPGDGRHYVTIWVLLDHVDGEAAPLAVHELDRVAWHRPDDLPGPRFSTLDHAISLGLLAPLGVR